MKTVMEPLRINSVEPTRMTAKAERGKIVEQALSLRHFIARFEPL